MANNQLANTYQQLAYGDLSQEDVSTIKQTIAKDCNDSQFRLFMAIAKSSGANPVMNEVYPTVRSGQLTVQFGVDFFVRKAKESEGYLGYDVQLVHENDEFKMHQAKAEDGLYYMVIDEHSFGFPRGKVVGGYCIAYREGHKPFTVIMEVDEVDHFKKSNIGMQKTMWTNYFNDMFKKHIVRRALKAAYSLNYDDDQVVDGGSDIPEYQERKDITPEPEIIDAPKPNKDDNAVKQVRSSITKVLKDLGVSGKAATADYLKEKNIHIPENPSLDQLNGALKTLEAILEVQQMESSNDDLLDDDDLEKGFEN